MTIRTQTPVGTDTITDGTPYSSFVSSVSTFEIDGEHVDPPTFNVVDFHLLTERFGLTLRFQTLVVFR